MKVMLLAGGFGSGFLAADGSINWGALTNLFGGSAPPPAGVADLGTSGLGGVAEGGTVGGVAGGTDAALTQYFQSLGLSPTDATSLAQQMGGGSTGAGTTDLGTSGLGGVSEGGTVGGQ